jgi:hypothetical protein
MKRSYVVIAVVVLVLLAAFWLWRRSGGEQVVVDLVAQFPTAERRSSIDVGQAYSVGDQTIAGETKPGVYMHPTSRLTFKRVTIPDDGHLRAFIAVKEDAWDKQSDGVLFRFAVSDGRQYDELLNHHVDPAHNANDRRWQPVDIDLSAYAGQQVDLIFNTNSSVKGAGDNPAYDFAVWGAPAIVVKR